jgi:hypothetical protein
MNQQRRYIVRATLFLLIAAVIVGALHQIIWRAFLHNPLLNGLIIGVLLIGIVYNYRRMLQLRPEQRWIEAFRTNRPGFSLQTAPRLLAPIANVLGERERRGRAALSALSIRYLLDSTIARLDESRDIARYQTGLLIFLGLLGTFWGLLEAINAVGAVISGLSIGSGDTVTLFNNMKTGLSRPLSGMGTAFSSSLFGLAGSLVLGFLDLQATQAQNGFYNELEEWLSSMGRFSSSEGQLGELGVGQPLPVYLQAMLEQTAENLERLHGTVARSEEGRTALGQTLELLGGRLGQLGDRLERQQELLVRMADGQLTLADQLGRRHALTLDEATREHIRNTDQQLGRLVAEIVREREELKHELKLVARTIAIAAGEPPTGRG